MAVERKFIEEAVNRLRVKAFVKAETLRAGFGGLEIQRTPLGTRVNVIAERPGMVIGRRGATINALTAELNERFGMQNPQIGVEEPAGNPALNAQIMAIKVAESLERGWHFRRVGHSTVQRIMGAGAQGVIIEIAGKLTGQRKRREKFIDGHVKYCGETAHELMETGHAQCKKKLGIIGCTVRIMRSDAVLPDQVKIYGPGEKEREAAMKAQRAQQAASGVQQVAAEGGQEGRRDERPSREGGRPAREGGAPAEGQKPAPQPAAQGGEDDRGRPHRSFTVGGDA